MSTVFEPAVLQSLDARLQVLQSDSPGQWGRMSAGGMLCHLSDGFLAVLGERAGDQQPTLVGRTLLRFLALHTPITWPANRPAPEHIDQERGGTPPGNFDEDRERLRSLMHRFAAEARGRSLVHPVFGRLSSAELGRWAYRHVDHHLRQFGV